MARFIIKGPTRISGEFVPAGNKNAALPMLAAALLTDEPVKFFNIPEIDDVYIMLEILAYLGVSVEKNAKCITLRANNINQTKLPSELCRKIRGSIVLAGPLAICHGQATVYTPGGDAIGRRRVDTHFDGFRSFGMTVEADASRSAYNIARATPEPCALILDEASVTATENLLMVATLIPGRSTIYNAACEPHVQDLCQLLKKMGACIEGIGTNRLIIDGVEKLYGAECSIAPDYIETGSFIAAAAATGGELTVPLEGDLTPFRIIKRGFLKLGVEWSVEDTRLHLSANQELTVKSDLGMSIPKIEDGIWPAFPSDLMSVCLVLATQSQGSIIFFEKMFESRMYFVDRLIEMGARIVQCDPHRVVVNGISQMYGTRQTSPDIRAGMALLIAALCAKGESVIENAQMIDRGYANIDARLRALGADIERVED